VSLCPLTLSCCRQVRLCCGSLRRRRLARLWRRPLSSESMRFAGCAGLRRPRSIDVDFGSTGFSSLMGKGTRRLPNGFGPKRPFVLGSLIARNSCAPMVATPPHIASVVFVKVVRSEQCLNAIDHQPTLRSFSTVSRHRTRDMIYGMYSLGRGGWLWVTRWRLVKLG
jgi:hypothetical protein